MIKSLYLCYGFGILPCPFVKFVLYTRPELLGRSSGHFFILFLKHSQVTFHRPADSCGSFSGVKGPRTFFILHVTPPFSRFPSLGEGKAVGQDGLPKQGIRKNAKPELFLIPYLRWRRASKSRMAALTETLRLSRAPSMGMRIRAVAAERQGCDKPRSSVPMTMAVGPVMSVS